MERQIVLTMPEKKYLCGDFWCDISKSKFKSSKPSPGTWDTKKMAVLLKSHLENRNKTQLSPGLPLLTSLSHAKGNQGLFLGAAQKSGCHCTTGGNRAVVRRPRKRHQEWIREDKDWTKSQSLVMGTEWGIKRTLELCFIEAGMKLQLSRVTGRHWSVWWPGTGPKGTAGAVSGES